MEHDDMSPSPKLQDDLIRQDATDDSITVQNYNFGPNFVCIRISNGVREIQTVIRDKTTSRNDFIFYCDRLIRLVVEEGLNRLPYLRCKVTTPTGHTYDGLHYEKGSCGVSIVRSGEAMEHGLRDCCRSIRIGKILVRRDEESEDAKVIYTNLPKDIHQRKVLLMSPLMSSGNAVAEALKILKAHDVNETSVVLLNLFSTPQAAQRLVSEFPGLTILTSEVHPVAPTHFGHKYFGTD